MPSCHAPNHFSRFDKLLLVACAALVCCFATACSPDEPASSEPAPVETYFPIQLGERTLQLQFAITPAEQQKGLMFRDELATDSGMLFLFEKPEQRGFWMKNTRIPLDIGYFAPDGRLLEIHQLYPFDETPVRSRSDRILIAVETNQGWFKANGIRPGARLDMNALKATVEERGFNPAVFAISD
jgi:uncharacterized membrane protein (UPF0127 family)